MGEANRRLTGRTVMALLQHKDCFRSVIGMHRGRLRVFLTRFWDRTRVDVFIKQGFNFI